MSRPRLSLPLRLGAVAAVGVTLVVLAVARPGRHGPSGPERATAGPGAPGGRAQAAGGLGPGVTVTDFGAVDDTRAIRTALRGRGSTATADPRGRATPSPSDVDSIAGCNDRSVADRPADARLVAAGPGTFRNQPAIVLVYSTGNPARHLALVLARGDCAILTAQSFQ